MYFEWLDDMSLFGGKNGLAWVAILDLGEIFENSLEEQKHP